MGDEKWRLHLDALQEIYMMAILNLKTARDKCSPPIGDLGKTDFKIEYMVLVKNHPLKDAFDSKYIPSFRICKKISDKVFDEQQSTGKAK